MTIKLTPEQERAMNALQSGAYIVAKNGRMFTAAGTYFRVLGSKSFVGMIKKGVIKMTERENGYGEIEKVWVVA